MQLNFQSKPSQNTLLLPVYLSAFAQVTQLVWCTTVGLQGLKRKINKATAGCKGYCEIRTSEKSVKIRLIYGHLKPISRLEGGGLP